MPVRVHGPPVDQCGAAGVPRRQRPPARRRPTTTLADGQILHDAPGAYHAIITTAAAGSVEYRGYSLDGAGNPLASTPAYTFAVTEF
jgi:hypothetical protein